MSTVKSFRFDDQELSLLYSCMTRGNTAQSTIVAALEYYFENVIDPVSDFDVIVDFKNTPQGVNAPVVDSFIKEVNSFTNFKLGMYLDGDQVGFYKDDHIERD